MQVIDLFCGMGGLTRGLEAAGWESAVAVEIDPNCCETYHANFPNTQLFYADIRRIDLSGWRGEIDLVAGGPPCQPFSVAGLQLSHKDERNLVPDFINVVEELAPRAFLMENVAGMESPRHRPYLFAVLQYFRNLGFKVSYKVVDAATYGVPQFRRRLIVVGMRDRTFRFPRTTHGNKDILPYVNAREAIANAPQDLPNTAIVTYAKNPILRPQPWDGMLVNGGGRPINLEEPCQTIPASAGGNRTHIVDADGVLVDYHRELRLGGPVRAGLVPHVRRLTVAESASIQTFPSNHVILGPQSSRYRQVGNAVPPTLAEVFGRALLSQLQNSDEEYREDTHQLSLISTV